MNWRSALARGRTVRNLADAALNESLKTAELLTELFECNVFVHNAACVRRHDGAFRERCKNRLTRRIRRIARGQINARLADHVARRNAKGVGSLFVIDERCPPGAA